MQTSFYIGTVIAEKDEEKEKGSILPMEITGVEQEGELYIGGEGVTRGYLHAPELTAKVTFNDFYSFSILTVIR